MSSYLLLYYLVPILHQSSTYMVMFPKYSMRIAMVVVPIETHLSMAAAVVMLPNYCFATMNCQTDLAFEWSSV